MQIHTTKEAHAIVIALGGKLDAVGTPVYEQAVDELIAAGESCFILDFERLGYISSAGLRALLATAKRLKSKGGQIRCAAVGGMVREVFDLSGFAAIFPMDDTVADALAGLG